jgi:beta-catenin-like protein 1
MSSTGGGTTHAPSPPNGNGSDDDDHGFFVPSETFAGSRSGSYFGTGPKGTGYYRDDKAAEDSEKPPAAKKARRTVGFDDGRNTTLEYDSAPAPATDDAMMRRQLEEAEKAASQTIVIDLTPKGARTALKHLLKAHEVNAVMRSQHEHEPHLYMDSEVSLYEHLQALKGLAADPATLYPVLLIGADDNDESEGIGWETIGELLGHANPDVGAAVVNLLLEWLDPSLLLPQDQEEEAQEGQRRRNRSSKSAAAAVVQLARRAVQDAVETIVTQQLLVGTSSEEGNDAGDNDQGDDQDEPDEDDVGKGVDDVLSLLENLLEIDQFAQSSQPPSSPNDSNNAPSRGLTQDGMSLSAMLCRLGVLSWLFRQLQHRTSKYRDRALELLVLVAAQQDAYHVVPNWSQIPTTPQHLLPSPNGHDSQAVKIPEEDSGESLDKASTLDGMEILLQTAAEFRKRQPIDEAELSVLENCCMVMGAALLLSPHNLKAFVERQGIELSLRCLQERVHAGGLALKWLDVGTSSSPATGVEASPGKANGTSGAAAAGDDARREFCEHMVKAGVFKYLFPMFMGRHLPKAAPIMLAASKRAKKEWSATLESTVLSVLYCLTVHLTDKSPDDAKERLVAKFMEEEKCDRLVELCLKYDRKARQSEFDFYRDVEESIDDVALRPLAALAAKLEGGGDVLHRACALAAFCCVSSRRCHERILSQLQLQQSGITLIRDALHEFASNLDDETTQKAQLEAYLEKL